MTIKRGRRHTMSKRILNMANAERDAFIKFLDEEFVKEVKACLNALEPRPDPGQCPYHRAEDFEYVTTKNGKVVRIHVRDLKQPD
jgi:hypothetical protein